MAIEHVVHTTDDGASVVSWVVGAIVALILLFLGIRFISSMAGTPSPAAPGTNVDRSVDTGTGSVDGSAGGAVEGGATGVVQ